MIHFIDILGMERFAFPENVGLGSKPETDAVIKRSFYVYADGHCHQVTEDTYNSVIDQLDLEGDDDVLGDIPVEVYNEDTIFDMLGMMSVVLGMHTDKPKPVILRDISVAAGKLADTKIEQPNKI